MKYYLDEDLSPKIFDILRRHGIDAISAQDVGMLQASDMEQLKYAASECRCLVTRNRNDFIVLTVQFFNEHRLHKGILIVPHTLPGDNFSLIAKAIMKHHKKYSKEKPALYSIDFL
ncbi:MAG: DUF5615 family PIN-like protein [Nitrospirae bacterium]|nr:DUF5615 family PIN-like protein [Nitrospirota bacterium]